MFTFSEGISARISGIIRLYEASRSGSNSSRISGSSAPSTSTLRTPGTASRVSCNVSAISFSWTGETSPEMLTSMIGNSARFISLITGSSESIGNSPLAISTRSRTRCRATSLFTSGVNSTSIIESPSALLERISLTPRMPLSSFSIFIVTDVSMSSGETPSYIVVTIIWGMGMSGKASRGNEI